jgi:hypothetical protein
LISGFRRHVDEICALLGYYSASSGSYVPSFRDHLSVPSSRFKKSWPLKMGPIGCPETSVQNYHSTLSNIPEERRSHEHRGESLRSCTSVTELHSVICTLPDCCRSPLPPCSKHQAILIQETPLVVDAVSRSNGE